MRYIWVCRLWCELQRIHTRVLHCTTPIGCMDLFIGRECPCGNRFNEHLNSHIAYRTTCWSIKVFHLLFTEQNINAFFFENFLWSTVQIDLTDSQECLMTGGGLPGIYVMDQMHFHWASEHTINRERYKYWLHGISRIYCKLYRSGLAWNCTLFRMRIASKTSRLPSKISAVLPCWEFCFMWPNR